MMRLFLTFFILLTVSYITSHFAEKRGRNRVIWFILGLCFGLFALLALFLLPSLKGEEKEIKVTGEIDSYTPEPLSEWHYIDVNGRQMGPVSFEDLAILWSDGLINGDSYVWRVGMSDWARVKNVEALYEDLSS